jgi:Plasmid pRiA4b ORF-3-like protein
LGSIEPKLARVQLSMFGFPENQDRMSEMRRFTSYGICALCGKRTTKAAMTRHLGSCLAEHEPSRGKAARLFRLRIEDAFSPIFWMDVEIKANATLEELDDFLRHRWLECCSHLSAFYIEGDTYMIPSYGTGPVRPFGDPDGRSMKVKLGEVLSKGSTFQHVYDFGTSTELKLRVADEREGRIGSEPLRLLSLNEAPVWECEVCGEDAEWICTFCVYERENPFYCELHAEDHGCEEPEMLLPVVNSPRMGMCGYEGPE